MVEILLHIGHYLSDNVEQKMYGSRVIIHMYIYMCVCV